MVFASLKDYLAWKKPAKDISVIGVGFHQLRIADDMTEHLDDLIQRIEKAGALNYAKLRAMPNKDKKVAFVFWNSPEGEENFSASFLNIPESLANIFAEMKQAGYKVPLTDPDVLITQAKKLIKPYYRVDNDQALRDLLTEDLAEKIPVSEYKKWLTTFPESQQKWIQDTWGDPEDNYLTIKEDDGNWYFIIPRLKLGNVMIMLQPNLGSRRDREKDISHDKKIPLHHAYRAVYHYIVDGYKADAIVHVGTHGTQEWLAGKERGLWAYDDSYSTIGSTPVVYPYSVANTGEALIAKRRGQAVVISHNTPPFAPAGLYGDLIKIHEKMHEIGELEDGAVKEETKNEIEVFALKKMETVRIVTRITPMLGLIATLASMGPALVALQENNSYEMGELMGTAFLAVTISLVAASLTFWMASVKKRWFAEELVRVEKQLGAS